MNRLLKLIESIKRPMGDYGDQDFYDVDIESIMIKYAEEYAHKCLSVAAQNAFARMHNDSPIVEKTSITQIRLPEHT